MYQHSAPTHRNNKETQGDEFAHAHTHTLSRTDKYISQYTYMGR